MNDRRQTPDILAEILTGDAPAADLSPQITQMAQSLPPRPKKAAAPKTPKAPRPAAPTAAPAAPPLPHKWFFRVVSLQEHHGWRPRYIDGQPVKDWENGLLPHELLTILSEDGWELVAACSGEALYGRLDKYQLYFKKPA